MSTAVRRRRLPRRAAVKANAITGRGDLTGMRFGRLVVVRRDGVAHGHPAYICKCDCGNKRRVIAQNLRRGLTRSCGCLQREVTSRMMRTHGLSLRIPEYRIWLGMRERCSNPRCDSYRYYGLLDVKVDRRWDDFAAFLKDVGRRPSNKYSLDRIDPFGDTPGNVRWATARQQRLNRRANK